MNRLLAWRAPQPVVLMVGGRRVDLAAGRGTLDVRRDDLRLEGGVALCAVAMGAGAPPGARVDVLSLHVVTG